MDPFLFALLFCVFVDFNDNYCTSRLNKEPPSERLVSGAFMILPPAIWSLVQFVTWRRSEAELDICWLSFFGVLVSWCLVLWGCFTEDEVYQYPPRVVEPLEPRTVIKEAPAATEVKETRESESAAAPTEVKRIQKRQGKPWIKPGCSSVQEYRTWKRTELTPGHAPTPESSVVRRQPAIIVPRHKYSSYSHLLAQPSLASSFGQVSHRETRTPAARPQKTAVQEQITANLAARKAALNDPYTPQQRAILFPASSSADILSALQPSDRAHVVTEWLRLSAVVMETMDESPLFNTGFANSAASQALRTDRVLRTDLEAISNRFDSLLGWVTHGTSLFWDLSRLDARWMEQRLSDIVVMERFLRNLGERHGGLKRCEWTWKVHEAVRAFGVAMVGMMKIDVQRLSKKDLEELDSAVTQELAKAGQVNGRSDQQYGQSYDTRLMTEQVAPPYQPADGASLDGGAGKTPQTSAASAFGQQQSTTQSTAPPASFSAPIPQPTGTGNHLPPAFFTALSSQQTSSSILSTSAQPVPATTSTQTPQTQSHPQTRSTNLSGLAASKFAPQNVGFATSQPAGPSGSSTASTTLTNTSASQAGISGASQVARAPGTGLVGNIGPGSASSVNGTPGSGPSTFGAQPAGLVVGGQNTAQRAGQAGWLPVPSFSGREGFGNQTTAVPTTSASGFGATAANASGPPPIPAPTPASSIPNPAGLSDNKPAGHTPAALDTPKGGVGPVLNHETGKKLRAFEVKTARQYVGEYLKTARRDILKLQTYIDDKANLESTLSGTTEISDRVSKPTLSWTQIDKWGSKNLFDRDARFGDIWVELYGIPKMLDECIKLARGIMKAAKSFDLVAHHKSTRKLRDEAKELRGGETRMLMQWPPTNPPVSNAQGSSTFVQPAPYTNDSFPCPGTSDNAQVSAPVPDSAMQSSGSGPSSSLPTSTSSPPADTETELPALGPRPTLDGNTAAALHELPISIAQRHFDSLFAELEDKITETVHAMTTPAEFKQQLRSSSWVSERITPMVTVLLELHKWPNLGDLQGPIDPKKNGDDYHRKTRLQDEWEEARQISALLDECIWLGNGIDRTAKKQGWEEYGFKYVSRWLVRMSDLRRKIPMLAYEILLTMPIDGEIDDVELECS
ncbi:hypothetical protein B0A48_15640 [Cryoendolithus antarcticus]|uniref:Uncharacterized protein n=1 Tax=Cryoendolithus antarcticus TaxID=1507870 RepID=A0A1V8SGT9_9PEZI|nr:hypothetical protein B0A48_15640 [Cryoendolithus antarcticus]